MAQYLKTRRMMRIFLPAALCCQFHVQMPAADPPKPNVLLILVDDLKLSFGAYHAYPRRGNLLGRAVRTQRYRLVEWKQFGAATESAEYELHDDTDDPLETVNLASRRPSIVAALKATLARHREPLPPHK